MELLLGLAAALLMAIIVIYNILIKRRNAAENAFAGIDVYLTMRYDLIPNLVETVKAYAKHEQETLQRLTALRASAGNPQLSSEERVNLDNQIGNAMQRLFALSEAYPDLKASANFLQLQGSLNEVEERLSAARRYFNTAVMQYNNAVEQFPSSLVATVMGLQRRSFLVAPEGVREAVSIK